MIEIKKLKGEVIYAHRGADLRDADLRDADLSGADLSGANLSGANLSGAKTDQRFITIGCIGSSKRQTTYCFDTDTVWRGCFKGTLDEFAQKVEQTHKNNTQYLAEYRGAIAYIRYLKNPHKMPASIWQSFVRAIKRFPSNRRARGKEGIGSVPHQRP